MTRSSVASLTIHPFNNATINYSPPLLNSKLETWNLKLYDPTLSRMQRFDLSADLDKITIPTLMIAARFDDQAPAEELQFIFETLGSTDKFFELFQDAGHNVFLDKPQEFRQTVSDFINNAVK